MVVVGLGGVVVAVAVAVVLAVAVAAVLVLLFWLALMSVFGGLFEATLDSLDPLGVLERLWDVLCDLSKDCLVVCVACGVLEAFDVFEAEGLVLAGRGFWSTADERERGPFCRPTSCCSTATTSLSSWRQYSCSSL